MRGHARGGATPDARADLASGWAARTCIRAPCSGAAGPVIELGVNVDHVATVRQARRTYEPDPVWAAVEAHLGGADGITVHLREDRRHIQDEDVRRLRELTHIKLNLEMAATEEMVAIARAHQARRWRCSFPKAGTRSPPRADSTSFRRKGAEEQVAQARRGGHRGLGVHRRRASRRSRPRSASAHRSARSTPGPYAHAFHAKGRDAESAAVVTELKKIREAGEAIRAARHALQRRSRAELLQRRAGGAPAGRARAAHRPRDRVPRGVRRHARGGARDEALDRRRGERGARR